MSDTYVLDSFAVLALLAREAGSEEVSRLLHKAQDGETDILMTWVNVGEVAYIVERRWGANRLYQALATLEATAITIVPAERELSLAAARVKARHPLAYADAFAAALAMDSCGTLVTGDPEFKVLADRVSILWLPGPS